jgi:DNA-binding MarR family transcriptional regulator
MAQVWQQALDNRDQASPADLARQLAISRARVTQVLHLLKLAPEVVRTIAALGDPLPSRIIIERTLRSIVHRSTDEQRQEISRILAKSRQMSESPI